MTTATETRITPNVKRQNQVNDLTTKLGVFWAFSNEQFDKNKTPLKEGEKYVSIGMGGFIAKSNFDALIAGMKIIDDEFKEAMKDEKARRAHIAYELNNHEAYYTRSIDETMAALGDDFTREEVMSVFHKHGGRK